MKRSLYMPDDVPLERDEHRNVVDLLQKFALPFHHSPMGGKRRRVEAAILKGMGAQKGFPDFLIFRSPPRFPEKKGVAVELKRVKGGTFSNEQRAWLELLEKEGWVARMCRGFDEVVALFSEVGYLRLAN